MVQTDKDREHKKRQQKRQREQRQESLEELMGRIPPLSESLLVEPHSTTTATNVQDVYQSIPTMDKDHVEKFWNHVPDVCNPKLTMLDSNIVEGLDERKRTRDENFQKKFQRKLKAKEHRGEITREEYEHLWNQHGRKQQQQQQQGTQYSKDAVESATIASTTAATKGENDSTVVVVEEEVSSSSSSSLLSKCRGQRKAEQVENFVSLLRGRLSSGMTVVDFGSGSGNLCLALASYFTNVQFILVDRNEFSLQLVQKRIDTSQLSNVHIQQFIFTPQNVKEYHPPGYDPTMKKKAFDLGIGLHCCGSFTDMVMETCMYQGADCIVCPCCNGGMTSKATGGFSYPRSSFLQQCMTQEEYLSQLSRHADNAQNYAAKCWIEYDRALWAKEMGAKDVELWKMEPLTCTPKHHVLFIRYNDPIQPSETSSHNISNDGV